MRKTVWTYNTSNFKFVCEEDCEFADPLLLGEFVAQAVNNGQGYHIRLWAEVRLKHGTVVGQASKSGIIQPLETGEFVDYVTFDHHDRREVVRRAIEDARRELGPMVDELPEIRIRPRKTKRC